MPPRNLEGKSVRTPEQVGVPGQTLARWQILQGRRISADDERRHIARYAVGIDDRDVCVLPFEADVSGQQNARADLVGQLPGEWQRLTQLHPVRFWSEL